MKRSLGFVFAVASVALAAGPQSVARAPQAPAQQPAGSTGTASTADPAAQQAAAGAPADAGATERASSPGTYLGVASCASSSCHGSTQPLQATRVLQNEYFTWLNSDRHARAYNVLFDNRSKRIARNMRLRGAPHKETLCLDCHSSNVPTRLVSGVVDLEDGIQCETCHGPAGGWRAEHTEPGWTHEKSVERGLVDLRLTTVRAGTCLPCHMGNASKEVDHELIASGHPALAFELDNYSATMPPHWTRRSTHGVPAFATGQVVAFRDSMTNLARHARSKWPEFADMSCVDCHHSLKDGQWRQERGYTGRAGMPSWSPARFAVLRRIVSTTSPQSVEKLDAAVADVAAAVGRFSDGASVAAAAERARQAVDPIVSSIASRNWSESDTRALMRAVAEDQTYAAHGDVFAAEQQALALQSLSSDLARRNPRLLRSDLTRSIDELFGTLEKREEFDVTRYSEKLAKVKAAL